MFNRIKRLEKKVDELKDPPKFKCGDKVKGHTIIEHFLSELYSSDGRHWQSPPCKYSYKSIKDGKQVTVTELELTNKNK